MLSRHEADCKLHVSGVRCWKGDRYDGGMHYMSSQKKANQTGKALWARDGSCCV